MGSSGNVLVRLYARSLGGPGWDWCLEIALGRCTEKVLRNFALFVSIPNQLLCLIRSLFGVFLPRSAWEVVPTEPWHTITWKRLLSAWAN